MLSHHHFIAVSYCYIVGISNTVGRVLSGFICMLPGVSPLLVNNISISLAGVILMLTPFCTTYITMALAAAATGLFCCEC